MPYIPIEISRWLPSDRSISLTISASCGAVRIAAEGLHSAGRGASADIGRAHRRHRREHALFGERPPKPVVEPQRFEPDRHVRVHRLAQRLKVEPYKARRGAREDNMRAACLRTDEAGAVDYAPTTERRVISNTEESEGGAE